MEPLDVFADPPVADLEFPSDVQDEASLARYWQSLNDVQFLSGGGYDHSFLLAMHKTLFGMSDKMDLPFSHGGAHILEDRGSAWHQFGNRSGEGYYTRYADFLAATQGTVEAVSLAVNRWGNTGGLRLCVGVTKPTRAHHALQLNTDYCEWNASRKSWSVYHDGAMSQVAKADVLEAVREAGAGEWIGLYDDGKEWIYLGEHPDASKSKWRERRRLLANLIHYGIIRSNLREALSSP